MIHWLQPTVSPRATFLKDLNHKYLLTMNTRQKGFMVSVRALDPGITGTDLKETKSEKFPPYHLFTAEIKETLGVWVELRKYLDQNGNIIW